METQTLAKSVEKQPAVPLRRSWRSRATWLLILLFVLVFIILGATATGSVEIPLATTARILMDKLPFLSIAPDPAVPPDIYRGWEQIVWNLRLPRVLLAGLVGAA